MIAGYMALYYGSDYCGYAIKSVYDQIDKFYVVYTNSPSQGHGTNIPCPDTKDKLRSAVYQFGDPQNKIEWVDGNWQHEGQHRDFAVNYAAARGADQVLVVDADEIWDKDVLANALEKARRDGKYQYGIRMLTFWRSFSTVAIDDMLPIRIKCPKVNHREMGFLDGRVFHFGYARKPSDISFKLQVQGHKNEFMPGWFQNVFMKYNEVKTSLHPTCKGFWNAEAFDKSRLPEFMKSHPYWNADPISD